MLDLEHNRWALIGIVSTGAKCADGDHPGIYTRYNMN